MSPPRRVATLLPLLGATLLCFADARALKKVPERITTDREIDEWHGYCLTTLAYYNLCAGWVWVWSDWEPESRIGVSYERAEWLPPHCDGAPYDLVRSWLFVWTGCPAGYGYTGTVDVWASDAAGCPVGTPLASQAFLPTNSVAWHSHEWSNYVPPRFAVTYTLGPAAGNPLALATDAASVIAPGGGIACGTCFPVDREPRSFFYGTLGSALCPGEPFVDEACAVQLLQDVEGFMLPTGGPVSLEPTSWGAIKALYR